VRWCAGLRAGFSRWGCNSKRVWSDRAIPSKSKKGGCQANYQRGGRTCRGVVGDAVSGCRNGDFIEEESKKKQVDRVNEARLIEKLRLIEALFSGGSKKNPQIPKAMNQRIPQSAGARSVKSVNADKEEEHEKTMGVQSACWRSQNKFVSQGWNREPHQQVRQGEIENQVRWGRSPLPGSFMLCDGSTEWTWWKKISVSPLSIEALRFGKVEHRIVHMEQRKIWTLHLPVRRVVWQYWGLSPIGDDLPLAIPRI